MLGRQSWLFTGILPHGYGSPNTFCFDYRCMDDPIMVRRILTNVFLSTHSLQDDANLHDYNVPDRVQAFIQAARDEVCITTLIQFNLSTFAMNIKPDILGTQLHNQSYYDDFWWRFSVPECSF